MTRRPPRTRQLSENERRLWEQAMRETRALKKRDRNARAASKAQQATQSPEPQPRSGELGAPSRDPSAPHVTRSTQRPSSETHERTSPPITPLARREARRIVRNPEAIDARLDLHGMRQREAYPALKGFLRASQARGFRLVLIITGKGVAQGRANAPDVAGAEPAPFYESQRGVLRRLVPEWLGKPEFHDCVAGVSPAHPRHGGEGALYVRLRRPARRVPQNNNE